MKDTFPVLSSNVMSFISNMGSSSCSSYRYYAGPVIQPGFSTKQAFLAVRQDVVILQKTPSAIHAKTPSLAEAVHEFHKPMRLAPYASHPAHLQIDYS
jgi:hypothetical protein